MWMRILILFKLYKKFAGKITIYFENTYSEI